MYLSDLEILYEDIENAGIFVYNFHVSETKKAACLYIDSIKSIAMDKPQITTSAEEYVILAEEFAHYETNALYFVEATSNTPIGRRNRIACEGSAKRYAIKKLLPFDKLEEAICDGISATWELAEYFNVTEDFIRDAMKYYFEQCGMSLER